MSTPQIQQLDLQFQLPGTIASYLLQSDGRTALVETGPHSCWDALVAGLAGHGLTPADIDFVLLTHIHFDHAGAAWALARAGARIHVHPAGQRHLADPGRLYESARRIYGDQMEPLWGRMEGIALDQLRAVEDGARVAVGDLQLIAHHTPGHAKHHIAWQLGSALFTGDVAGARLAGGPVTPPCPPPDIDIPLWQASIARLRGLDVERLYLTHFGPIERAGIAAHWHQLEDQLTAWAGYVQERMAAGESAEQMTPGFRAFADRQLIEAGLDETGLAMYEAANPAWMSVAGLIRYWTLRADAER